MTIIFIKGTSAAPRAWCCYAEGVVGTVKLKDDGSIEIDPYTEPLREDAVMMLEGLNELVARFVGLSEGARIGAAQNEGDTCIQFLAYHRAWRMASEEVRALRDRFSSFELDHSA